MKTLYLVYTEEFGEVEGMFDSDGNLLDYWSCNDASWRNEYFAPFMKTLGYDVKTSSSAKLIKKLKDQFPDEEDYGDEE